MTNSAHGDETKRQLAISFAALMEYKPLDKISIREITEGAQVNRQTFYYHFEDIFDLVKWILQEEAVKLLAAHEGMLFWQEGLLQLLRHIDENRAFCLNVLNSLGRDHLKRFVFSDIFSIIRNVMNDISSDKERLPENYDSFLTHFFTVSLGGLIESWLRGEMEHTPEELIAYIDDTIAIFSAGVAVRHPAENETKADDANK